MRPGYRPRADDGRATTRGREGGEGRGRGECKTKCKRFVRALKRVAVAGVSPCRAPVFVPAFGHNEEPRERSITTPRESPFPRRRNDAGTMPTRATPSPCPHATARTTLQESTEPLSNRMVLRETSKHTHNTHSPCIHPPHPARPHPIYPRRPPNCQPPARRTWPLGILRPGGTTAPASSMLCFSTRAPSDTMAPAPTTA